MSLDHFRKAVKLADDYGEHLTLGGGEPTIHPFFEQFLLEAIASDREEGGLHVITNGKIKQRALMLAKLADKGVLSAQLSSDDYHEEVDTEVYEAFDAIQGGLCNVTSGYRGDWREPILVGRAVQLFGLDHAPRKHKCICEEVFVKPSGVIRQCGCYHSPVIGHVDTGYDSVAAGVCYRSEEYKEQLSDIREAA